MGEGGGGREGGGEGVREGGREGGRRRRRQLTSFVFIRSGQYSPTFNQTHIGLGGLVIELDH